MASYYYLISSLPALKADAPMPFDYAAFLKMCENSVSNDVYKKLRDLRLDLGSSAENVPLVKQWGKFYGNLMNGLCKQRNVKLGKIDTFEYVKDSLTDRAIEEAMAAKDPLEAEKILLDYQFSYLDNLVEMHYFDDYVLFGYAVKLKLLERQTVFEQQAGKDEFKRLFDGIQRQILVI